MRGPSLLATRRWQSKPHSYRPAVCWTRSPAPSKAARLKPAGLRALRETVPAMTGDPLNPADAIEFYRRVDALVAGVKKAIEIFGAEIDDNASSEEGLDG